MKAIIRWLEVVYRFLEHGAAANEKDKQGEAIRQVRVMIGNNSTKRNRKTRGEG